MDEIGGNYDKEYEQYSSDPYRDKKIFPVTERIYSDEFHRDQYKPDRNYNDHETECEKRHGVLRCFRYYSSVCNKSKLLFEYNYFWNCLK
jgi:hypothetical protein